MSGRPTADALGFVSNGRSSVAGIDVAMSIQHRTRHASKTIEEDTHRRRPRRD
jgi:hypothetical protein